MTGSLRFPLVFRYLSAEGVAHVHPVVLWRIVAVDGLGEATAYVDEVIERNGRDIGFGEGNRFLQLPAVWLWVITLDLKHNENGCLIILKSLISHKLVILVLYIYIYIYIHYYCNILMNQCLYIYIYIYLHFCHFILFCQLLFFCIMYCIS